MEKAGFEAGMAELFETGLDGPEAGRLYEKHARSMQKSEVFAAFYLAEVDRLGFWYEAGYSSVIHFAVDTGDINTGKAYSLLRIGKGLSKYPILREAFIEGRISWTKLRELFRLKETFDEKAMLDAATSMINQELERFVTRRNERFKAARKNRSRPHADPNPETPGSSSLPSFPDELPVGGSPVSLTAAAVSPAGTCESGVAAAAVSPAGTCESGAAAGDDFTGWNVEGLFRKTEGCETEPEPEQVTMTLKFSPEQYAVLKGAHSTWKKENRDEWKREDMLTDFAKHYLENKVLTRRSERLDRSAARTNGVAVTAVDADSTKGVAVTSVDAGSSNGAAAGVRAGVVAAENVKSESSPVMIDSPYSVIIQHCPECGRNTAAGKHGDMLDVDDSFYERAVCDGATHTVDESGLPGRKKRSVSPALRKKIFMRDKGVCRIPGCGRSSFLEVHHIVPRSHGGSNKPSNMILTCHRCHKHIHEGRLRLSGTFPDLNFSHMGKAGGGKAASG